MGTIGRRARTFTAVGAAFWALTLLAPLWLLVGAVVGVVRRRRFIVLRLLAFGWIYTAMECLGIARALLYSVIHARNPERYLEAHYQLQRWWSETLFHAMRRTLSLRFEVEGQELVREGPFVLLMRHTSLVDTFLPSHFVANPFRIRLRYVLKSELLYDPCLDVVGNRLPNHFVDRSAPTEADLAAIRALAEGLGPRDGVIIFPEGTYFAERRRAQILARLRERGAPELARAESLERTLPPRVGGVAAILDGAPGVDVVVCAHEGLDGVQRLGEIASGALVGKTVRVAFWRVPAEQVPADREGRTAWLYDQWERVDARARAA